MGQNRSELKGFDHRPLLGILRGVTREQLNPVLDCSIAAGLKFIEITLNTPDALKLIDLAVAHTSKKMTVGAGTVLTLEDAHRAADSGAAFLVGPTFNEAIAGFSVNQGLPYFPGAYTPSEIEKAWNAGASMVKVFPASQLGPSYFKELKGPFPEIRTMAVGGVRSSNACEYLMSGASAVAVGGSVYSKNRLEAGEYSAIQNDLSEIMFAVESFLPKINP